MVSYKLTLDERRAKQDGTFPLIIRVTFNRDVKTFKTGVSLKPEQWDKSSAQVIKDHPNWAYLSNNITKCYLKIQKAILRLEDDGDFSFENLKEVVNNDGKSTRITKVKYFNDYAQEVIANTFEQNRAGTAMNYKIAVKRLMGFANNPKLKFTDINYSFLEAFRQQLVKDGLKPNAISTYFRACRAIYNKAIKAKLVDRSHYAFIDVTVKTERTAKRAMTAIEIKKIYDLELKENTPIWDVRNYFILSFALRGISISDLAYLEPSNIRKNRLIYKRKKTGQELNIQLLPIAKQIIKSYEGRSKKFLLPILPDDIIQGSERSRKLMMDKIKTFNKYLNLAGEQCEIDMNITTYVIRHTWATCAKRLGYSNELIAESLGHEYGNKITNIYLDNFEQSVIDEVNERVISVLK